MEVKNHTCYSCIFKLKFNYFFIYRDTCNHMTLQILKNYWLIKQRIPKNMHNFQKLDNYKNLIDKFCLKNLLGHAKMSPQYLMLTVYHLSKKAFC